MLEDRLCRFWLGDRQSTRLRSPVPSPMRYAESDTELNMRPQSGYASNSTPFVTDDRLPFLEVHHLKSLSDGGSDQIKKCRCTLSQIAIVAFTIQQIQYSKFFPLVEE